MFGWLRGLFTSELADYQYKSKRRHVEVEVEHDACIHCTVYRRRVYKHPHTGDEKYRDSRMVDMTFWFEKRDQWPTDVEAAYQRWEDGS
jgi:hypothetical protein